jgi:L-lactate dehydrogenase complex protein LldG
MSSRDVVLGRVRAALRDVPDLPPAEDVPVTWEYGGEPRGGDVLGLFVERCGDYGATVVRVVAAEIGAAAGRLLAEAGANRVVVPGGLDADWRDGIGGAGIEVCEDEPPLAARALDQVDGVVTACRVAIAETGTIVLDHAADQGRRALSLVPDLHLCVVRADQVVGDVPEAVTRLAPSLAAGCPLTWVSGPSATVDIELKRVQGVHGPRTLLVLLAE